MKNWLDLTIDGNDIIVAKQCGNFILENAYAEFEKQMWTDCAVAVQDEEDYYYEVDKDTEREYIQRNLPDFVVSFMFENPLRIIIEDNDGKIFYKGYTIEIDKTRNIRGSEYLFYRTCEGVQHDYDYDNDSYRYCGNCKWASSIQDAKEQIEEILN